MIESIVLSYLGEELSVPVYMEVPESNLPDRFVVIEKVGASIENRVTMASIAFQSYSLSSLYNAATLDEEVRGVVERMVALYGIGGVRLESNYNFTDTRTKRYRYQCVYDIFYVEER